MEIVEKRGQIELWCYPRSSWVVFIREPGKETQCIINGKFDDVWKKYASLVSKI